MPCFSPFLRGSFFSLVSGVFSFSQALAAAKAAQSKLAAARANLQDMRDILQRMPKNPEAIKAVAAAEAVRESCVLSSCPPPFASPAFLPRAL